MIPLQPTINLYYDRIIDNTPVPNGVSSYDFLRDCRNVPCNKEKIHPINEVTAFYNAMKVLEVSKINLFSGKETAKNLFYPLELGPGKKWDVDLLEIIPEKTVNRIRKGHMKLLILAPRISHDYSVLWKLRQRLDYMISKGITRDMIYIVLGDLNRTYRKLFDNPNVYGIDWWQIYSQITYNSRYGYKNWHWVFNEKRNVVVNPEDEDFQFEKWNPKRIFTALTGNSAIHNTTLVSELIYNGLENYGEYSYNLEGYANPKNYKDFRITDRTRGIEYIEAKRQIIEKLSLTKKIFDLTYSEIQLDPFYLHKSVYEDSLINIVSGSYSPMFDKNYLDEIDVISPGIGIWRQLAKGHPFMILGCLNTMGYISNEGYFLPTQITSQHYDRVAKTPEKVALICDNIKQLSQLTSLEIRNKVEELIPFMKKNKEKFFDKPNKRKFEKLFREMTYE